jgi:hypothetical protein
MIKSTNDKLVLKQGGKPSCIHNEKGFCKLGCGQGCPYLEKEKICPEYEIDN